MAITKIWSVKGRLDAALRYVMNPEKASNIGWYKHLHDFEKTMEYITDEEKTDERYFVSGVNCMEETAYREMIQTKARYGKMDKVQCFHAIQSFAPGEATPETAHEIGVKFAQQMWGDRFEVIVSTHVNTRCLHNHFVINSVSYKDGKKYYDRKPDKDRMRELSDALCREYSLSVVDTPDTRRSKHYAEWKAEQEQQPTWRSVIKEDVDAAIRESLTFVQFIQAMERRGYDVKIGVKYMAVRPSGKERFSRLYNLGAGYSEEEIKRRILDQQTARHPVQKQSIPRSGRMRGDVKTAPKMTGFRALYFHYLYKLGKLPRTNAPDRRVPFLLREDIRKMDELSTQAILLAVNKIDTLGQLCRHRNEFSTLANTLARQRKDLYNLIRRCGNETEKEAYKQQIVALTPKIKQARKEVKRCNDIIARSATMKETLNAIRENEAAQRKEGEEHGLQRRGRGGSDGENDTRRN